MKALDAQAAINATDLLESIGMDLVDKNITLSSFKSVLLTTRTHPKTILVDVACDTDKIYPLVVLYVIIVVIIVVVVDFDMDVVLGWEIQLSYARLVKRSASLYKTIH